MHYSRLVHGRPMDLSPLPFGTPRLVRSDCSIDWCTRKEQNVSGPMAGLCSAHRRRKMLGRDMELPIIGGGSDPVNTFESAHGRVRGMWGSPSNYPCIACGEPAKDWAYDGTDVSQGLAIPIARGGCPCFYSSWPEFYAPMCTRCHRKKDMIARQREVTEYREWRHRTGYSSIQQWEEMNS